MGTVVSCKTMYQEEYEAALGVIREAGETVKREFYKDNKSTTSKCDPSDLVTETDKSVESHIRETLSRQFPESFFIGEETAASKIHLTDQPTWIIDPIDGTTNFVHKNPQVCTILGLLVEKSPVFCLVYNPVLNQLWTARKGLGAFLNGEKINVSACKELKKSLIALQINPKISPSIMAGRLANISSFLPLVRSTRMTGTSGIDMAYVAMGAVDSFFHFGHHIWDYGVCILLVSEAGGVCLDPVTGGEVDLLARRVLVAASRELADQILPHITNVHFEREGE